MGIDQALGRLGAATSAKEHQFLNDDISILSEELVDARHLSGYRQLTDVYLLALAVAHGVKFVTLDTNIPLAAVRGATGENLVVL